MTPKHLILKPAVIILKNFRFLGSVAIRLTALTGKSKYPVHPKHLISIEPPWYLSSLNSNDIVLDIGCDNGQHTLKAAERVKKIIGIDIRPAPLEIAEKTAQDRGINNAEFKILDAEKKLPFPDEFFSKVIFLDVLEHLYRRDQIMHEVRRVLKKNGLLLISIPNKDTKWKILQKKLGINSFADSDHKIEYSFEQAKSVCEKAGLKIIDISYITLDTPLAPFIDLTGGISLPLYRHLSMWKRQQAVKNPADSSGFRIICQK